MEINRGVGSGFAACWQDGKNKLQHGRALPSLPHHFPLCLTAGVNFTLSCHLLDKVVSSWFPLDLILREPEH